MLVSIRLPSLIVLVLLLASVGTASAECAWVLWKREVLLGNADAVERPWEPPQAVPDHGACEAAETEVLKNIARSRAQGGDWISTGVTGNLVITLYRDPEGKLVMTESQEFRCLPDTIDPRGPKGGA
jgi:hypothetical protein